MKYLKKEPSQVLSFFIEKINDFGYQFLTEVTVDTKRKMVILRCEELVCELPCEFGVNGITPYELSSLFDGKTPLCNTRVRHIDLPVSNINKEDEAVMSKTIKTPVNFGPCFICLYITLPGSDEIRGIGLHGSEDDTDGVLRPTEGCIRMYNADLYLIRNLFYKNLKVSIV